MAILEGVPGIRVSILSSGRPLQEYPDEEEFQHKEFRAPIERTSTNYIECVSDNEFQIKFDILPDFLHLPYHTHVSFWALVDGKGIGGMSHRYYGGSWNGVFDQAQSRVSDHEVAQRRLKFCGITKVDDGDSERIKSDVKLADGLGEIIVHVHRSTQSAVPREPYRYDNNMRGSMTEISEKALKGQAISHGIAFGNEQRVYRPMEHKSLFPDGYSNPMGIFRFKYRSRDALQQELIIPRTPTPDFQIRPLNPRNQNDANLLMSPQERLQHLKREIAQIKSEVKEEPPRGRKRRGSDTSESDIMTSGRAYKTSRQANGSIVVDLTDD